VIAAFPRRRAARGVAITLFTLLLVGAEGDEELDERELFEGADEERLLQTVARLSGAQAIDGVNLASRHVAHPDHGRARDWLEDQLVGIPGLQVHTEPFSVDGIPATNIIAHLAGRGEAPGLVIVGAHYDSTASGDPPYDPAVDPAPGADDDASGVAAVLEIARLLAAWEGGFEHDLRFVLFDAEELGLLGSRQHVQGLDREVTLMASLDPIGFNAGGADRMWFAYDARWTADAEALEARALELDVPLLVAGVDAALIGGDERSDHFPFWEAGHPALHVGTFPQPPAYHTADDTLDVVDPRFLRDVTGLLAAHFAAVAGPLPVQGSGCSCGGP
jgi:hypothetical protein